jgi:ankyrin repeat protein
MEGWTQEDFDEFFLKSSYKGDTEGTEGLIQLGANVNVRDENNRGRTALIQAAFDGNLEMFKLLFRFDADPAIQDYDEMTPYRIAVKNNKTEIIKYIKSPEYASKLFSK